MRTVAEPIDINEWIDYLEESVLDRKLSVPEADLIKDNFTKVDIGALASMLLKQFPYLESEHRKRWL